MPWPFPTVPLGGSRERLLPAASAARTSTCRTSTWRGRDLGSCRCRNPGFLPELGMGFAERRCESNSGGGKGLTTLPTTGGCGASCPRGPGAQYSRLLRSLAPGTSGPWHELWSLPDPRGAPGCFTYGGTLKPSAAHTSFGVSMEVDTGAAGLSHFPGLKFTKLGLRLQKSHP